MTKRYTKLYNYYLSEANGNLITLYRGLEKEFDPKQDLTSTDAPNGYSTWTDNPELARQYAGEDGYVYKIDLPQAELRDDYIDNDGERALFYNNEKPAGLNGISGDEYLVYHDHELFDIDSITPHSNPLEETKLYERTLPSYEDQIDALQHASDLGDEYEELNLKDFKLKYLGEKSVEDLYDYDDLYGWLELEADPKDTKEDKIVELMGFRGKEWGQRALNWLNDGIPPIVIVETPDGYTTIGDGRGRVNFANLFNLKIPTYILSFNPQ